MSDSFRETLGSETPAMPGSYWALQLPVCLLPPVPGQAGTSHWFFHRLPPAKLPDGEADSRHMDMGKVRGTAPDFPIKIPVFSTVQTDAVVTDTAIPSPLIPPSVNPEKLACLVSDTGQYRLLPPDHFEPPALLSDRPVLLFLLPGTLRIPDNLH